MLTSCQSLLKKNPLLWKGASALHNVNTITISHCSFIVSIFFYCVTFSFLPHPHNYSRTCWLGVKHQVAYLLFVPYFLIFLSLWFVFPLPYLFCSVTTSPCSFIVSLGLFFYCVSFSFIVCFVLLSCPFVPLLCLTVPLLSPCLFTVPLFFGYCFLHAFPLLFFLFVPLLSLSVGSCAWFSFASVRFQCMQSKSAVVL